MDFIRTIDPHKFPFAIEENPLPLKETKEAEEGMVTILRAIEDQVVGFEKELLGRIDHLESIILEFKGIITNVSESPPETKEKGDDRDEELIRHLLPVMDGLEASLQFTRQRSEDDVSEESIEKTKFAHMELETIFEKLNITKISSVGEELDSKLHIPVGVAGGTGLPDYTITQEKLSGYIRNGEVIRQTKVIVAKNDG